MMENCLRSKPKHDVLHGSSPVVGNFTSVGDICPAAPIVDIAGYLIVKPPITICNRSWITRNSAKRDKIDKSQLPATRRSRVDTITNGRLCRNCTLYAWSIRPIDGAGSIKFSSCSSACACVRVRAYRPACAESICVSSAVVCCYTCKLTWF